LDLVIFTGLALFSQSLPVFPFMGVIKYVYKICPDYKVIYLMLPVFLLIRFQFYYACFYGVMAEDYSVKVTFKIFFTHPDAFAAQMLWTKKRYQPGHRRNKRSYL
jgi:hypothetical protein